MKEILESNLVSAIIALIGVIVSLKWSTSETAKRMEQALKVYEKATIIPHFKTQNMAVPFELLFRGNYFYYNNQIFIKTGTEEDVTNAVCLTNYGTPIFVTNNTQVNLITELQLEYKD